MKEQFVTYEIALALKELGFDEECFGCYINDVSEPMNRYQFILGSTYSYSTTNHDNELDYIMAPLWQQVIDWFREKFEVYIELNGTFSSESNKECYLTDYSCLVTYKSPDKSRWEIDYVGEDTLNYYEAREQAILKAIEIIKQDIK